MHKSNLGSRKYFFHLTLLGLYVISKRSRARAWNLGAGTEAEAVEEHSPACSTLVIAPRCALLNLYCSIQDTFPGASCKKLDHPIKIINPENSRLTCGQVCGDVLNWGSLFESDSSFGWYFHDSFPGLLQGFDTQKKCFSRRHTYPHCSARVLLIFTI